MDNKYDEKQLIDRGKAFQLGFGTALFTMLFAFVLVSIVNIRFDTYSLFLICFWIPMTVFFIASIIKDVLDGANSAPGRIALSILSICGLYLLVNSTINLAVDNEKLNDNGFVTELSGSIFTGICMLGVSITYWIKQYLNMKKYTEE